MRRPRTFDEIRGHDWLVSYFKEHLKAGTVRDVAQVSVGLRHTSTEYVNEFSFTSQCRNGSLKRDKARRTRKAYQAA